MKKCLFKGSGVALVTPMNSDGTVNYEKLKELVEWHIENNTDAVVVCGTTGESATLTEFEHSKIISTAVEVARDRICVIAGTGSNNTDHAVKLSKNAQELGANGILVVTPYYNKASQAGLLKHYNKIADSVSVPLILYEVPSRTGCRFEIETLKQLSLHENIVALKAASGDISNVVNVAACLGEDLAIYSGNDDQVVPIMAVGGLGVISVLANVLPKQTHDMCELFFSGNFEKSKQMQLQLLKLINMLFVDVNPIPVKDAMNLIGMGVGSLRLPLCSLDDGRMEALKCCLIDYGLIKKQEEI